MTIIPPGFHFAPTDQELITFYLSRKAMGQQLPWNPLLEKSIYGESADPWDAFSDAPWDTSVTGEGKECKNIKSVIYVFTKLSKVNGKTRIARTAGCGTWDGQTGGKKIYNNSRQVIGLMKMLTYTEKKTPGDSRKQRDYWIMHEYSLVGVSLNCELLYKDYVVCRITRSSKESVPGECSSSSLSSCGENQLSNDNDLGKKRSAAQSLAVTSQKKQKVDSTSPLQEIEGSTYVMPIDGLMPQHDHQLDGQECSQREDESWLNLLLELEDGYGSTYVGPSGDDNFASTSDSGYANAAPPEQLPMPVDGCLMPQHDQLDGSWLDLLLGLEDGDGSWFDFHLDDEDASEPLFDLSSSQSPDVSL